MKYRPDIDGLRALAVAPVILFHAGVPGFAGGFVGVDVFFVISGFLITRLLLDDIARQKFSILAFYDRRLRRIAPALVAMLLTVEAAALVLMAPGAARDVQRSLISACLFASNLFFYSEGGYFATPSLGKPLLHTWSLSVEEQFYIAFPPLLYLLRKSGRARIDSWLVSIGLVSLGLSLWRGHISPEAAFYLPQARVWELLLGSLLANRPAPAAPTRYAVSNALGIVGLALVVSAITRIPDLPAPRVLAAFGAALLIFSGSGGDPLTKRALSAAPLVGIGLISYSLYLWHWPMIVFTQYLLFRPLRAEEIVLVICATSAVAVLSWRYVERPFRRSSRPPMRTVALGVGTFASLAAVSAVAVGVSLSRPEAPPQLAIAESQRSYGVGTCLLEGSWRGWKGESCFLTPRRQRNALLWGDSFAAHYAHVLSHPSSDYGVIQYTTNSCPPALGYDRESVKACRDNNDQIFDIARRYDVSTVVIAGRWAAYEDRQALFQGLSAALAEWSRRGVQVILVGQSEDFSFQFEDAERAAHLAYENPDLNWQPVAFDLGINEELRRLLHGGSFFDPLHVCRKNRCPILVGDRSLVIDHGHLSNFGSDFVGGPLLDLLAESTRPSAVVP